MATNGVSGTTGHYPEIRINLIGLEETLRALRQYDPDARKQLFNAISLSARMIRDDARKIVPTIGIVRGWREQRGMPQGDGAWKNRTLTRGGRGWPPWEVQNVKTGIKSYMSRRRASKGSVISSRGIVVNRSGEGVIAEFARYSNKSRNYPWVNSTPLLNNLGRFHGGRIIWAAAERNRQTVNDTILDALQIANKRLQDALDAAPKGR